MLGTGTERAQRRQMLPGRVSLVASEAIAWPLAVECLQGTIAADLGQNRSSRDTGLAGIASDNRDGLAGELGGTAVAVDQCPRWSRIECDDSAPHRQHGRLKDIQGVDLQRTGGGNGVADSDVHYQRLQARPGIGAESLGIIDSVGQPLWIQDHGGGEHRPGQRATACLIDTSHQQASVGLDQCLRVPSRG